MRNVWPLALTLLMTGCVASSQAALETPLPPAITETPDVNKPAIAIRWLDGSEQQAYLGNRLTGAAIDVLLVTVTNAGHKAILVRADDAQLETPSGKVSPLSLMETTSRMGQTWGGRMLVHMSPQTEKALEPERALWEGGVKLSLYEKQFRQAWLEPGDSQSGVLFFDAAFTPHAKALWVPLDDGRNLKPAMRAVPFDK